jgi:hypothetical protein
LGGLVVGEHDEFAGDRIVAHDPLAVRRDPERNDGVRG